MAFVNLFNSLSSPKEDSGRHAQPAFTHRNFTDYCPRGGFRKRKTNREQPGPSWKRPCYREQTNTAHDSSMDRNRRHPHGADRGNNNNNNNNNYRGTNPQRKNGSNGKKQQQQRQQQQQQQQQQGNKNNNHQRVTDRGLLGRRCRGGGKGAPGRKYGRQDVRTKPMRMDPKFKEQNVVELDGRMLCRHFFLGACIKGDQCQLEHVQGYNGLIKECCKFYVQGQCTRGQSCPFMHKSVPCKFFHRRGACSQGANCRFSHEPLDEVTGRVLEVMLKRENDFIELAKKAKEESSRPPVKPMVSDSDTTEVESTPDVVMTLPLRPNFYNSAEKETPPEASEVPPSNHDIPSSPSPKTNRQPEPVCYSVEAVLGPSLSKPFTRFQTTSGTQESTSPSANPSFHKKEVPYSVDSMLRSCKTESMAVGQTTASPKEKMIFRYPRADRLGNMKSSHSPRVEEEMSINNNNERIGDSPKPMFKSLPSLQETKCSTYDFGVTGISEKCPKSLKTTQSPSCEVNVEMLLPLGPEAEKCESSNIKVHVKESQYQPIGTAHSASFRSFPSRTFSSAALTEIMRKEIRESPQSLQDQNKKDSLETVKDGVLEFEKTMYKTIPFLQESTNSSGLSQGFRDKTRYLKTAQESSYKVKPKLLASASSQKMIGQHKTPASALKTWSFSTLFAKPITDTLACTPPSEIKDSYCSNYDQLIDKLPKSSQDLHEDGSLDPVSNVPLNSQEGMFSGLPSLQAKKSFSGPSKAHGEHARRKESLETAERPFHKVSCELQLPFVPAKTERTKSCCTNADSKDGFFHTTDPTQFEGQGSPHKNSSIRLFARPITGSEMTLTTSRNLGQLQKSSNIKGDPRKEEVSFDSVGERQTQEKVSRFPLSLHESKTFSDLSETSRGSMKHKKSKSPETWIFKSSTLEAEINKCLYQPIKTSQSKSHDNQKNMNFHSRESTFSSLFARPITHTLPCTPSTEKTTKSPQDLNQMVSLDSDNVLCSPSNTTSFTNLFARPNASSIPLNRNYPKEINEPLQNSTHQDKMFLLDTDKEGVLVTKVNPFRSLPSLQETKSCSNLPQASRLDEKHHECLKSGQRNPHQVSHKAFPQSVTGSEISKSFKTKINVKEESCQHTDMTDYKGQRSPTQHCLDTNNLITGLFVRPCTDGVTPCSPHPQGDNISLKFHNQREKDKPVVQTLENKTGNLPSLHETNPLSGLPQASEDHRGSNETLKSSQRSSCKVQPESSHPSKDFEKFESLNTEAEIKESSFQAKDTTTRPNVQSSLQSSPKCSEPRRLDTTFSNLFVGAFTEGVTSNTAQPHARVQLAQLNGNEEPLPPSGNSDCDLTDEPLRSANHHKRNALPGVSPSRGSLLKTLFLNLAPFQMDGNQ